MTAPLFAKGFARKAFDLMCKCDLKNIGSKISFVGRRFLELLSRHIAPGFLNFFKNKELERFIVLPHSKGCGCCQNARIDIRKIFGHLSFLIGCLDAPMMEGAGELGNQLSRCKSPKFRIAFQGAAA